MYKKALLLGLLFLVPAASKCSSSDFRYVKRALIVCKYKIKWALEDCDKKVGHLTEIIGRSIVEFGSWLKKVPLRLPVALFFIILMLRAY